MNTLDADVLLERIARLEHTQTRQTEIAVCRGALVWPKGAHQLDGEDKNPCRTALEPLSLSLDYAPTNPDSPTAPQLTAIAQNFLKAARQVFLMRQLPAS